MNARNRDQLNRAGHLLTGAAALATVLAGAGTFNRQAPAPAPPQVHRAGDYFVIWLRHQSPGAQLTCYNVRLFIPPHPGIMACG